jgi:hypothetical protein
MVAVRARLGSTLFEGERIGRTQSGLVTVQTTIEMPTSGEALVRIFFPVKFIELPWMSSGCYLAPNQTPGTLGFPRMAVPMVDKWDFLTSAGVDYYVGARVHCSTTGSKHLFVQLQFEGRAIRNPSTGQDAVQSLTTDDTI